MQSLEQAKQSIVQEHGPWTAANLDLGQGVFTIGPDAVRVHPNIVRFGQIIQDITNAPLPALRILDLACLEGEYAIELARQGAQVVGIEGRAANIAKARFAKEALGLKALDLFQDDVRNLSRDKYGSYDAVICSGILYHLAAEDQLPFIERLGEVCDRCLIVDTHVGVRPESAFVHKSVTYAGSSFIEHHRRSSQVERDRSLWASLDNRASFWLTRGSLYNALAHAGFTSVYECHMPPFTRRAPDRVTLVAIKGKSYVPATRGVPMPSALWSDGGQATTLYRMGNIARSIVMRLPYPITRALRSFFGKR